MDYLSIFGERLADLMKEKESSVKQLSSDTGIRLSRLYEYLNRTHFPSCENAIKIANLFGCPLDYLFGLSADFTEKSYGSAEPIPERVRYAFDHCKFSRYYLSKKTQISESQLSRWYNGTQTPTLLSLIVLCTNLNCSLDYLAGRTDY